MNNYEKSGRKEEFKEEGLEIRKQISDEGKLIPGSSSQIPNFFRASAADFKKIPGSPIAYWVSDKIRSLYRNKQIKDYLTSEGQILTGNNVKFLRYTWEVSARLVGEECDWKLHHKGGNFRKWHGNVEWIVDWKEKTREFYRRDKTARIPKSEFWNLLGITWSTISSSKISFRKVHKEESYNKASPTLSSSNEELIDSLLGYLNSKIVSLNLEVINPTLNYLVKDIEDLPIDVDIVLKESAYRQARSCLTISKKDWDSYETSWDFTSLPLLHPDYRQPTLKTTYAELSAHWREMTLEIQRLEEENNRVFIDAYGLQDELTPEVPLNEITLTCNPHYRYGSDKREEELEALLLADTMKEFISYAVGCMFGRYALDKPVLILANQGENIFDFRRKILDLEDEPDLDNQSKIKDLQSKISFMPDIDNVIPILEGDWFPDDISERFRKFLRVTFGEEHYEENLAFIEKAMGKDIRKYFLKDFYTDHVKRYKKRPIYWLFSSPKGSFNALIYMHRYRPDTISVVLNDYLREFRTKLISRVDHLKRVEAGVDVSQAERTKALKEIEKLNKMIKELEDYEREVLYPLATEQVEIDLDDGVKVNYGKFGNALKKINF